MSENLPATTRRELPSILLDSNRFDQAQRAGNLMALSALVPDHIRAGGREVAIANCVLIQNIADRMREDPIAVAQAIYFVHGRPGWLTSYMISRANQSGVFKTSIRWKTTRLGDPIKVGPQILPNLEVTASARMADDGERVEATVTMRMAIDEGWTARGFKTPNKPSKYETMGEQMLRWRAATFLIRLYCPEVMLGYSTREELEDVAIADDEPIDITPPNESAPKASQKSANERADGGRGDPGASRPGGGGDVAPGAAENATRGKGRPGQGRKPAGEVDDAETVEEPPGEATTTPETAAPVGEGEFDPSTLPERERVLFERLVNDLNGAKEIGFIEMLRNAFAEALDTFKAKYPDAYERLEEIETEARERVA